MERFCGLDFGTTNSALALAPAKGPAALAEFSTGAGGRTSTFRSVLFFEAQERGVIDTVGGPEAIARYLGSHSGGRLIQSLKSYLASRLFESTRVFGRTYTLEELVAVLLRSIRGGAERSLGPIGERVVVGRPVRFANSDGEADETLALTRLREGLRLAGFTDVVFEYEPVGAAWFYESSLDHDETVLIGDFGGGTSDFCLMRVGPGARSLTGRERILGTEGVGLAGDAFDSEIVDRVVAPRLGRGSSFRSYLDGKRIPVPQWIFQKLRRWHHLSFLKSRETMHLLREIHAQSEAPEAIEALLHLIDYDLGYQLYKTVEGSKVELSSRDASRVVLRDPPLVLDEPVLRAHFNDWISGSLAAIRGCVDRLLATTGARPADVDRVFLTGGSSLVPAVRRVFQDVFGAEKIRGGDELTSVALGLALRARDL